MFQREHGIPTLYKHDPYYSPNPPAAYRVTHFFGTTNNNDHRLDIIELVFSVVFRSDIARREDHIEELNRRFRLACVGYQFVEGKLVRLDSTVAHKNW